MIHPLSLNTRNDFNKETVRSSYGDLDINVPGTESQATSTGNREILNRYI